MTMSNPRDISILTPRTQEHTGGFNPREVLDLDINPNEDSDGLSHHTRHSREDMDSLDQMDPKKRRLKALQELLPALPHISVKPVDIDDDIGRTPMAESNSTLLESGMGVDMGHMARGGSISAGANVGPIRSDTSNIRVGRENSLAPGMLGKSIIEKGKRRYKGRKYEEDEEDEEERRKSKKKRKRERRRKSRSKSAFGSGKFRSSSREPKSTSKRKAASAARQVDRTSKRQAFGPNVRSLAIRNIGAAGSEGIPLRLRDPIAWERKKAYERQRRARGAMPRGLTVHYDPRGVSGRGTVIGAKGPKGTKMPPSPRVGTSTRAARRRINPDAAHDPLGDDPLLIRNSDTIEKRRGGGITSLTRSEIMAMKKQIESLLRRLEKVTKATPELGDNAKRGGQASPDRSSDPSEKHFERKEDQAAFRFGDTSIMSEIGVVSKR